eukprot:3926232-Rhodomonas_salina.3
MSGTCYGVADLIFGVLFVVCWACQELEYSLRDIDALHAKGVLSDADYEAQKSKVGFGWRALRVVKLEGRGGE